MARISGGGPQARALGYELRKTRELDRVTTRDMAARLEIPKTRLLRYESGEILPAPEEVARYLGKLSVSRAETERIVQQAREAQHAADVTTPGARGRGIHQELATLVEFESTATSIVEVAPLVIPGLLQTSGYARAVLAGVDPGEMGNKLALRLERQDILQGDNAPALVAIIGEAALREPLGGTRVLHEQLAHLMDVGQRPNITVQVLRSRANALNPAHHGQFMLFDYANTALPVVHVENYATASFTSSPKVVAAYQEAVGLLREAALSSQDSLDFIADVKSELETANDPES